jgi:hypothetical protein
MDLLLHLSRDLVTFPFMVSMIFFFSGFRFMVSLFSQSVCVSLCMLVVTHVCCQYTVLGPVFLFHSRYVQSAAWRARFQAALFPVVTQDQRASVCTQDQLASVCTQDQRVCVCRQVLTVSEDRAIKAWDMDDGECYPFLLTFLFPGCPSCPQT